MKGRRKCSNVVRGIDRDGSLKKREIDIEGDGEDGKRVKDGKRL